MTLLEFVHRNNEFCIGTVIMVCITIMVVANIISFTLVP